MPTQTAQDKTKKKPMIAKKKTVTRKAVSKTPIKARKVAKKNVDMDMESSDVPEQVAKFAKPAAKKRGAATRQTAAAKTARAKSLASSKKAAQKMTYTRHNHVH